MKIGEAANLLGTTPATLRQWDQTGELLPTWKTKGGTRYYAVSGLLGLTVFSARLYGSRSHKHKHMMDKVKEDVVSPQD